MYEEILRYYKEAMDKSIDPQLDELFFPVDCRSVYWEKDENAIGLRFPSYPEWTGRYVAIVDRDRSYLFTIASESYLLVSNLEAYWISHAIAKYIFKKSDNNENFEFVPFRKWMNESRSACEISICRKIGVNQPELKDGWCAGITMINSYNKSIALTYYIGFFNLRYKLSLVLPEYSINFKLKKNRHNNLLMQIAEQLGESSNINKLRETEQAFWKKLEDLKNTSMDGNMFLAFFCKFFRISKKGIERDNSIFEAIRKRDFINERKKLYIEKYGQNAYSFLLGISDYISNYDDIRFRNSYITYHIQAGGWADEYLKEVKKPDFSLYKYIGEEALNTASWLNTL